MSNNEECCAVGENFVKMINIALYLKNKGWIIKYSDDENYRFVDFSYKHDEEQYHISLPFDEQDCEKENVIQFIADIENRNKEQVTADIQSSFKHKCGCCCGE